MLPVISELELARYRSFRDRQSVALARLTLVYGENNSGKSALVRLPYLLAASRTVGRCGLELDPRDPQRRLFSGARYRDIAWRGALPDDEPADMQLGITLSDSVSWLWQLQWPDSVSAEGELIQRLEVKLPPTQQRAWLELVERRSYFPQDLVYESPTGRRPVVFDGLVPRSGLGDAQEHAVASLVGALERVSWLGALRAGPGRSVQEGLRREIVGNGDGAETVVLSDKDVLRRVSEWYAMHTGFAVATRSLGDDLRRVVLQASGRHDVPFPDVGEGLQQCFSVVVALEVLRQKGGLLIVEEPESHLHPKLQAALAELIVSVLEEQPGAQVLLETHSEVFLVSALRAAVRGLRGDVRLHWIEMLSDGAAQLEPIELDESGRPNGPRLHLAFETMGVLRRKLLDERRVATGK